MCQFFSCIIEKQNYEVVYDTQIDDHETLIKQAKLVDDTNDPEKLKFARVEIVPPNNDVFEKDFKKWTLKIDEKIIPEWFNPQCEENCFKALKECLAKVVIDGNPIVTEIIDGRVFNKNSKIVCRGNAQSENYDNAHSMNYGNAHSMNRDSAQSENYDNAHSMNRDSAQSENYDNAQSVNYDSAQSVLKSPCAIAIYPEKNKIVILKTSKYKLIKEKP